MEANRRPLAGIRVVDLSQVFAMPYAGGLLGDLGAEVIKIEGPNRPDSTRGFSAWPENEPGEDSWNRTGTFHTLNRNKRSFVLDLTQERAREIFLKLAAKTDVVVENFTPRVMKGWGLDYESLKQVKPDIIMISNTGYGSTGPWSQYPSQGTVLEATIGISAYTGYRGDRPGRAGQSYPDFLATWTGLFTIQAALHYRNRTGRGQWIDLAMYQLGASLVPEALLQYQIDGTNLPRIGNEHEEYVPYNLYPAAGIEEWIAISVTTDEQWQRLAEVMGCPELGSDQRYATKASRVALRAEIDALVADWTRTYEPRVLARALQENGVAASAVLNSRDLLQDPHLQYRNFFERVRAPEPIGVRPIIGLPYTLTSGEVSIAKSAPRFGEDNVYVLKDIVGLDDSEIEDLQQAGIIADRPLNARRAQPMDYEAGLRAGTIREVDPDYRARLGLPELASRPPVAAED
jgi:crotonobetainyl-CoA:carnitine CoA-transferase CaiB-like acyl-CoA transferase